VPLIRKTQNHITRGWAFAHRDRAFCDRPASEVAFFFPFFLYSWLIKNGFNSKILYKKCYNSAISLRAFREKKKSDFNFSIKFPLWAFCEEFWIWSIFWSASYFKRCLTAKCSAGFGKCSVWEHEMLCRVYRVAKMHNWPCFNESFSAKEPYN